MGLGRKAAILRANDLVMESFGVDVVAALFPDGVPDDIPDGRNRSGAKNAPWVGGLNVEADAQAFVSGELIKGKTYRIPTIVVYDAYREWCTRNGKNDMGKVRLYEQLRRMGYERRSARLPGQRPTSCILGLALPAVRADVVENY